MKNRAILLMPVPAKVLLTATNTDDREAASHADTHAALQILAVCVSTRTQLLSRYTTAHVSVSCAPLNVPVLALELPD